MTCKSPNVTVLTRGHTVDISSSNCEDVIVQSSGRLVDIQSTGAQYSNVQVLHNPTPSVQVVPAAPVQVDVSDTSQEIGAVAGRLVYQMTLGCGAPAGSSIYLHNGAVPTSAAPIYIPTTRRITGVSAGVDRVDVVDWGLVILINGAIVAQLTILAGETKTQDLSLAVDMVPGDCIAAYMISDGSPRSKWRNVFATVEVTQPT